MSSQETKMNVQEPTDTVEVTGVVIPEGVGVSGVPGQSGNTLILNLQAWRMDGGPLTKGMLSIRRHVTDEEFSAQFSKIQPGSVIRARIASIQSHRDVLHIAELIAFEGIIAKDPYWEALLAAETEEKTYADSVFGALTYDSHDESYAGAARWNGVDVELRYYAEEGDELELCSQVAKKLWEQEKEWTARSLDLAVDMTLEEFNECWLDDEEELTEKAYRKKLTPCGVNLFPDGNVELVFGLGDNYPGTLIGVEGELDSGPSEAGIY